MMSISLCAFASGCLRGPEQQPYNGKFLISEHHEEWGDLVSNHKRLCILASRDHGKSPGGGTLILRPDGSRVEVQNWKGGEVLAYNPETHKLEVDWATPSVQLPKEQCYKITTRTGREVKVNAEHKFKVLEKWIRADELKLKDRIAVPRKIEGLGKNQVEDAWLLGALVGNGSLTAPTSVMCSTADPQVVDELKSIAARRGWEHKCEPKRPYDNFLTNSYVKEGSPLEFTRSHDLQGKGSYEKRVPDVIFTSTDFCISEFLSGLFDTDTHVNTHGGGQVEFFSVSEHLMRDVQHLLTRLGIVSVLSPKLGKYKGEDHHSWRITIRGQSICKLHQVLNPRGKRKQELAALSLLQAEKEEGGSVDLLPKSIYGKITHSAGWFRKKGCPGYSKEYDLTRSKALLLAEAEGNPELKSLAEAEILWDEVIEIEDLGLQHVYGITVKRLQNYVANDIINHNTFFFDLAFPIWMAWKNPGKSGFIFSSSQDQSARILKDIREEIEGNPKLAFLLPKKFKKWNDHQIQLANGHTIYARGFGTRVRGAHPVWIVCDDVLNDESAYSETVRKKQNDYFFNAISNMVGPSGHLIVVGTPMHSQDLYSEIRSRPAYKFKKFSAIKEDGTPLWRERYCLKDLKWKRDQEIGPLRFSREFLCESIVDEISLFPSYFFKGPVELPNVKLGMPRKFWLALDVTIYMGVDFAMSASTAADYTVIWVMGVDPRGNRWIIDIFRAKGMPYRVQKSKMIEYGRRYQPALIFLEANQMQRIFGDELILDTDLPIKKFTTTAEKHSLEKGLPSLRTLLEAQKFKIPRGDERSVILTNDWIAEMGGFIFDGGKVTSVTAHDDIAMACWICDQAIRTGNAFSASWDAHDVYSQEEIKKIQSGEWAPTLNQLLEEQMRGTAQDETDETPTPPEFGPNIQIVAEDDGDYEIETEDEEEIDDVWTGKPLPSSSKKGKANGTWKPQESIPVPTGGGWFR